MKISLLFPALAVVFLVLQGCAPPTESDPSSQNEEEKPDVTDSLVGESEAPVAGQGEGPGTVHFSDDELSVSSPDVPVSVPVDHTGAPDWSRRYWDLVAVYEPQFTPPPLGQRVSIQLASGQTMNGVLTQLTDSLVTVQFPNGSMAYPMQALSRNSAMVFFKKAYAGIRAREHALKEYRDWQRIHYPQTTQPVVTSSGSGVPQMTRPASRMNPGSKAVSPGGRSRTSAEEDSAPPRKRPDEDGMFPIDAW